MAGVTRVPVAGFGNLFCIFGFSVDTVRPMICYVDYAGFGQASKFVSSWTANCTS